MGSRIFLLSPANCSGKRARIALNEAAPFPVARALREPAGAPLGDVFSFMSGLYFRGKLAYATAFERPPAGASGTLVITTTRGLLPAAARVRVADIAEFAAGGLGADKPAYREALERAARELRDRAGLLCDFVLLGSIATGKYLNVLLDVFGERLRFPAEFVGRGDMSRGGLMLRCASDGRELEYVVAAGAVRRGARPPKLAPR